MFTSIRLKHLFGADCFEAPAGSNMNLPNVRTGVKEIIAGDLTSAALTYAGTTSVFSSNGQYLCSLNPDADFVVKCIWYSRRASSYILASVAMSDDCNCLHIYATSEKDCLSAIGQPMMRQLNLGRIIRPGYVEYDDVADVILAYEPAATLGMPQVGYKQGGKNRSITGYFRVFCYTGDDLKCIIKLSAEHVEDVRLSGQHLLATMAGPKNVLYMRILTFHINHLAPEACEPDKLTSIRLKLPQSSPVQFMEVVGPYLYLQQKGSPLLAINIISHEIYRYLMTTATRDLPEAQLAFTDTGDYLAFSSGPSLRIINSLLEEFTTKCLHKTSGIPVYWVPWFGLWLFHGCECTKDLGPIQGLYITDTRGEKKRLLLGYDSTYLTVLHVCNGRVYLGSTDGTFQTYSIE